MDTYLLHPAHGMWAISSQGQIEWNGQLSTVHVDQQ